MYQLPTALPDELLLSRLIRFITISGISSSEFLHTCFGSNRISLHPFLTSGLGCIAKCCNEDTRLLLQQQTLAPLFCLFLPNHANNLQEMMVTNNGAKAFRASQLPSFGSGHFIGLKSCPICVQHDLFNHGVSFWHTYHQIPGVTTCGYHGVKLSFTVLTQRQRLIEMLLPEPGGEIQSSTYIERKVSNFSVRLIKLLARKEPVTQLADLYRHYLERSGYLTQNGRVRRIALMRNFFETIANHSSSNSALIPKGKDDFRYISQLLETDSSHHPYRHLLFATWLFDDVTQLFSMTPKKIVAIVKKEKESSEKLDLKCLSLLEAGKSLAQISRDIGKSRCYIKRIASLHDVPVNIKPKLLTPQVIAAICELAYKGFHRREIARRCGVGVGSVEQIISNTHGLVQRRKKCHFQSVRRKNRYILLSYLASHPESLRKDVKLNCSPAFFWLYLNDKKWLEVELPKPTKPLGRNLKSINC